MFVNCKNDNPTEAGNSNRLLIKMLLCTLWKYRAGDKMRFRNLPTRPNRTQYIAANIVKGIDANNAPNFPMDM